MTAKPCLGPTGRSDRGGYARAGLSDERYHPEAHDNLCQKRHLASRSSSPYSQLLSLSLKVSIMPPRFPFGRVPTRSAMRQGPPAVLLHRDGAYGAGICAEATSYAPVRREGGSGVVVMWVCLPQAETADGACLDTGDT